MSDQNTNQPGQTEPSEQRDADAEALGDAGKRAIAAERDARKVAEKGVADLTARLESFEQELQEARTAAATATENAAKASTEALRWKTVAAHKIDVEDAEVFITGGDEESITRQAERLAGLAVKVDPGPTTPKPDATQGASGEPAASSTAAQFAAAVEGTFN